MRGHGPVVRNGVHCRTAGRDRRVVGVPHGVEVPIDTMFAGNIGLRGGGAPVRTYIPELLDDVLAGRIEPGRVFDFETYLDGIAEAYAAKDERRAVKSLMRLGPVGRETRR